MPRALTEGSTLVCLHLGTVQLTAGQSKLRVNGERVLIEGDLSGAMIAGCKTVADPNSKTAPCLSISSVINGVATKLKVSGQRVLLETITGLTDGTLSGTPQSWSVQSAGQSKLQAI
jgi:hypothetical protein